MKTVLTAFGLIASSLISTTAGAQGANSLWEDVVSSRTLKVCVTQYAPNSFKNSDGEWRGFSVLMAEDAARAMNVNLELVESSWKTVILDLQSGRCHVLFGLALTPERNMALDFAGPLYSTAITIAPRKGFEVAGDKWSDIDKPEIRASVVQGAAQEKKLDRYAPNATKVALTTVNEAVLALQSGRADVYLSALFDLLAAKSKAPVMGDVVVLQPSNPAPSYAGFRYDGDGRFAKFLQHWADYNKTNDFIAEWIIQALEETGIDRSSIPANVNF